MNRMLSALARAAVCAAAVAAPFLAAPVPAHAAHAAAPASPVAAAAGPAVRAGGTTLCTTDEWQSPTNFAKCTAALKANATGVVDCRTAPTPDNPDSGLAGWFIARPDADLQSGHKGLYTRYGLGGYRYDTYDLGTVPLCSSTHPVAGGESELASFEFMGATTVIGFANSARDDAYHPADLWKWADPFIADTTQTLYRHMFLVFGVLVMALAGVELVAKAHHNDVPRAFRMVGWMIAVLIATTAVAQWPLRAAHAAETSTGAVLNFEQGIVGPPSETKPADQCPLPDPAGCLDRRDPATRASDTDTYAVLYRPWLRGLLGSADSPTAVKYGPALYDAATLNWGTADTIAKDPHQRQVVVDQHADQWNTVAAQIKTEDPQAYANLQGTNGTGRIGAGFIALSSAVVYAAFDLAASLVITLGFAMFWLAVVLLPLLATWGLWLPASGGVRRLANAVVGSAFNITIFGGAAGLYLHLVAVVATSHSIPGGAQFAVIAVIGALLFWLTRPVRKATATFGRLAGPDGEPMTGVAGPAARKAARYAAAAAATYVAGPAAGAATAAAGQPDGPVHGTIVVHPRPEARAYTGSTVTRAAVGAGQTRAAIGAGPGRPESRTGGAR